LATSAGFVVHAHFLTADVPVVFWMMLSFYCAQQIIEGQRTRDYVLAGALVGVATATKYNGLAVGIAIPVFHLFATMRSGAKAVVLSPKLAVAMAMVAVGFVAANPYAVLSFERFAGDFVYNYVTTPVYGGEGRGGTSYRRVVPQIAEIIGWPVTVLTIGSLLWAIVRVRHAPHEHARAGTVAALAVAVLYTAKFGGYPRLEPRFLLPVVPLVLIATGICWQSERRMRVRLQTSILVALLAYNLLSSYWVGRRFANDPRMEALDWVARAVPAGSTFESSNYTPNWNLYPALQVNSQRMPRISGRGRLFADLFEGQDEILEGVRAKDSDEGVFWYTSEALAQRRPDYIALSSLYYSRFFTGRTAAFYPEVSEYMTQLLGGALSYEIVFDSLARRSPRWLYPQRIGFVDSRVVILRRRDVVEPRLPHVR
jgi:hypothetical protein